MKQYDIFGFGRLASRMSKLPRKLKRKVMVVGDSLMVSAAFWCALALRTGQIFPPAAQHGWLYVYAVALAIPIFMRFGLYRAVVRFMGTKVVTAVSFGVLVMVTIFGLTVNLYSSVTITFGELVIFAMLCLISVGGSRLIVRTYLQKQRQRPSRPGDRVAIYGAGAAGAQLASSLSSGHEFIPIAFLDDSLSLAGSVINGIEVYLPSQLPELIADLGVSRVLLAVPSVSRRRRRKIIVSLEAYPVHVQTMPNFSDLISGDARVDEIREVDVGDLLGRDPVPPNESLLGACIRGYVVMVTGAGGSIGSELCRHIIRLGPARLLLFESNELALYNIDKELKLTKERDKLNVELIPLLGTVNHHDRIKEIMTAFKVRTVYHAAAYKHVPLVEQNIIEGIHNNIFGTLSCAEAAMEANVETFVLISTDKAVCPTNVMGATKRIAEIVLQGLHERGSRTLFSMVRFGNVLASSGSVVPLFREQIRRGGPVTVTHPEIIRYFMTIPEAATLVIQAGSMGKGGDVFLLDMGKPVRIEDLARRMIHLMGMTVMDDENPDGDIEIKYTGLRPAEKLYEELLIGDNALGTEHPMIMRAEEKCHPWSEVRKILDELLEKSRIFDGEAAQEIISRAVEEYTPATDIVDWLHTEGNEPKKADTVAAKVTPFIRKKGT